MMQLSQTQHLNRFTIMFLSQEEMFTMFYYIIRSVGCIVRILLFQSVGQILLMIKKLKKIMEKIQIKAELLTLYYVNISVYLLLNRLIASGPPMSYGIRKFLKHFKNISTPRMKMNIFTHLVVFVCSFYKTSSKQDYSVYNFIL